MPPKASFNEETNEVILAIEADNFFTMEVLDIYGTKVYSCPVMMVDGTPTNYVLPQLPAGIYTLKVESDDVTYEGTLVIE
ncbi:MAG: T9SS type A sorting domain-containing protein [Bacteroidales bacterium]|nr:T9SS type A sorting domain-containing protein [Bacteroidales bacterium]